MRPPSSASRLAKVIPGLVGLALTALSSGCYIPSPAIPLYKSDVSAAAGEVGLVPLVDRRPGVERAGKSPMFVPLVVYNGRVGEYVTGADSFTDDVPSAATRAIGRALSQGLGPTRLLAEREDPERACAAGMRYVASGTIRRLYGMQDQNAYVFFPLVFVLYAFDRGEPFGAAEIDLEVFDCVDDVRILREKYAADVTREGGTRSEAAKAALVEVARDVLRDLKKLSR